jgi:hypothetical protein
MDKVRKPNITKSFVTKHNITCYIDICKYGSILKKQVQHLSTNDTPDVDSIRVETCRILRF